MLLLDGVSFAYLNGPTYHFSMEAAPGMVTAVSGASGAGKSTLLDLIAGFLTPSAGRIHLDGEDISRLPPERRPVSILFQSEMLFEHLSARANVALGLPPDTGGGGEKTRMVGQALSEVGLSGVGLQRASSLSGGEKQRVALARTLLRNRPILLLDEPFSALDDATRRKVRTLVAELTQRHQWHTLLVSHYGEDVDALATRRYRLEGGVLLPG